MDAFDLANLSQSELEAEMKAVMTEIWCVKSRSTGCRWKLTQTG